MISPEPCLCARAGAHARSGTGSRAPGDQDEPGCRPQWAPPPLAVELLPLVSATWPAPAGGGAPPLLPQTAPSAPRLRPAQPPAADPHRWRLRSATLPHSLRRPCRGHPAPWWEHLEREGTGVEPLPVLPFRGPAPPQLPRPQLHLLLAAARGVATAGPRLLHPRCNRVKAMRMLQGCLGAPARGAQAGRLLHSQGVAQRRSSYAQCVAN
jgi:hypothetical protein